MATELDVLLVHAQADQTRAKELAAWLQASHVSINLVEADPLRKDRASGPPVAKAVVLLLSAATLAVESIPPVAAALVAGNLFPVKIGRVETPRPFEHIQVADLTSAEQIYKFALSLQKRIGKKIDVKLPPSVESRQREQIHVKVGEQTYMYYGSATTMTWLAQQEARSQAAPTISPSPLSPSDHQPKVFISYSHKDRWFADRLARIFDILGLPAWWDDGLQTGDVWESRLMVEIAAANCILVLWSKASAQSDWVLREADQGLARHTLVGMKIDSVRIPPVYAQAPVFDFSADPRSIAINDPTTQEFLRNIGEFTGSAFWTDFLSAPDGVSGRR